MAASRGGLERGKILYFARAAYDRTCYSGDLVNVTFGYGLTTDNSGDLCTFKSEDPRYSSDSSCSTNERGQAVEVRMKTSNRLKMYFLHLEKIGVVDGCVEDEIKGP